MLARETHYGSALEGRIRCVVVPGAWRIDRGPGVYRIWRQLGALPLLLGNGGHGCADSRRRTHRPRLPDALKGPCRRAPPDRGHVF
jgi:hypothetical protein